MTTSKRLAIPVILLVSLSLSGCFNTSQPAANQAQHNMADMPGMSSSGGQENTNSGTSDDMASSAWVGTKNTTRINSSDPIQAAVLISQTLWMSTEESNRPGGVILTDISNWQTALVSSDLIHHPNNGPVLYVNAEGIPDATLRELQRLNPKGVKDNQGTKVILVGDMNAEVAEQVKKLGFKTDIIPGGSPAAVAKAVDAYYTKSAGSNPMSVIIGSSDEASKAYTLPAVNWISHMPEPLLYVSKDQIPAETVEALKTREGKANIYILGPVDVISEQIAKELASYGKVVRIGGSSPADNAIAFARYKDPATDFGWGITTPGHNFSFISESIPLLALAAAPFSHLGKHAPMLWTAQDKLPNSAMKYLMQVEPKYSISPVEGPYNHAWITGDMSSINRFVQGQIDSALEITSASGSGHDMSNMDNRSEMDHK
ncbi:hypothetical protein J2Z69_003518 [Paenibacillus shirakamiensis]|uniref:ArsR family transcriptional regulator n=1 Tax=Paenibacillus shirakamiensis TaxID=1265935 RepID=A0ABS4JL62_9BACL|nr:cell wall-binding repeat-containing protein [Paenibacillus shirakamiensis]MBP2002445.1 hypothetical protein [Paenibacillus shirakamiensis]